MDILLGIVTKIEDPNKFIIRFSVADIIQDMIAYPADVYDNPELNEPVIVYSLETIFGYSYMYSKQRLKDFTRIRIGNSDITLTKDMVAITTENGNNIVVSSDGDVQIKSNGGITVSSETQIQLDAPQIKFPAGQVSGTSGPFNTIPVCPFSGAPHSGNILSK